MSQNMKSVCTDCGFQSQLPLAKLTVCDADRELFEAWCEDPRNGVIIADFAVAGTLAREVLDEPKEVISHSGHKVHLFIFVLQFLLACM